MFTFVLASPCSSRLVSSARLTSVFGLVPRTCAIVEQRGVSRDGNARKARWQLALAPFRRRFHIAAFLSRSLPPPFESGELRGSCGASRVQRRGQRLAAIQLQTPRHQKEKAGCLQPHRRHAILSSFSLSLSVFFFHPLTRRGADRLGKCVSSTNVCVLLTADAFERSRVCLAFSFRGFGLCL